MANPPQLPQYIYGLHDVGGQELMLASETPGWILDTIDLRSQVGTDYSSLAQAGLSLIVRLNYGYDRAGTIPPSSQYDAFAQLCATYVRNSSGARIWIIGNEMNASTEWPQLEDGTREVITPEKYARCFYKCRSAIKKLPGHANDWVLPGAVIVMAFGLPAILFTAFVHHGAHQAMTMAQLTPGGSPAARSMPCEVMPRSGRGARFATTTIRFPTRAAGSG